MRKIFVDIVTTLFCVVAGFLIWITFPIWVIPYSYFKGDDDA